MKFSAFIRDNLDAIVTSWEAFAGTLPAARSMSGLALRDHCREILTAVALDMDTGQTREQQARKSMNTALPQGQGESAAESHGTLRQVAGFNLVQLVAEFRALRASVLSLWELSPESSAPGAGIREITRFNEGLDQALAESVDSYSAELDKSRDMFIGVLGHDLRGPLAAIGMSNQLLERDDLPEPARARATQRTSRAIREMDRLITDLLDYTRTRLGAGIPIERASCDLGGVCKDALDAIQAIHPHRAFSLSTTGDLAAEADAPKLGQALANLLGNAVQHGDAGRPIALAASAAGDMVRIDVTNTGPVIPPGALATIFEPMTRAPDSSEEQTAHSRTSIGLGLYIAREIVAGHQGTLQVASSPAHTVFTICLPRTAPLPATAPVAAPPPSSAVDGGTCPAPAGPPADPA